MRATTFVLLGLAAGCSLDVSVPDPNDAGAGDATTPADLVPGEPRTKPAITVYSKNAIELSCEATDERLIGGGTACLQPAVLNYSQPNADSSKWLSTCDHDTVYTVSSTHVVCLGDGDSYPVTRHEEDFTTETKDLSCDAGEVLVGGACSCALNLLFESYPASEKTWHCRCVGSGTPNHKTHVLCIPKAKADAIGLRSPRSAAASKQSSTLACGTNELRVGGGCWTDQGIHKSYTTTDDNAWFCESPDAAQSMVRAHVICAGPYYRE